MYWKVSNKWQEKAGAGLTVFANPRLRHSADIGIMVHKDYQNMGVGSALMERLLDLADNWLMLVRVELTVFADNERAIHLYEKFGFEKVYIIISIEEDCFGNKNHNFN